MEQKFFFGTLSFLKQTIYITPFKRRRLDSFFVIATSLSVLFYSISKVIISVITIPQYFVVVERSF